MFQLEVINRHLTLTKVGVELCCVGLAESIWMVVAGSISSSFPLFSQVLWPFLLEFVKPAEYMEAFGTLSRCIAHIGGKKRESSAEDYFINFEEQGGMWERLYTGMGCCST